LRRVEKQDVRPGGDEFLEPRQGFLEAARDARIGAGEQQDALVAARLDSGAAAQDRASRSMTSLAPWCPSGRGHALSSISTAAAPRLA